MSNQLQQLLAAHWLLSPREPKTLAPFDVRRDATFW